MIFYHGTTQQLARQIIQKGFSPEPPSNAIWFTANKEYAIGHARGKAGARRDRPVVLKCELDLQQIDPQLSRKCIIGKKGVIASRDPISPDALRSYELIDLPSSPQDLRAQVRLAQLPSSPENLSEWVNQIFGLKSHSRVSSRHPGIQKLSQWMIKCGKSGIKRTTIDKVLNKARQLMPDSLRDAEVKFNSREVHIRQSS